MNEVLTLVGDFLTFIVFWLIVPSIMVGLIVVGRSIVKRTVEGENKVTAIAGWWAGLVLFVIYFIYKLPSFQIPEIIIDRTLELNIRGVILGTLVGFFLLLILKICISSRVVGFIILLLVSSGTSLLYSYFFIRTFNDILLSSTLGIAFGVLLHIIVMPKSIQDIFTEQKSKKEED